MRPIAVLVLVAACNAPIPQVPTRSTSIAISADDRTLFVVNPEADSLSVIDLPSRKLVQELPLGTTPPSLLGDRYDPLIRPRALALLPGDRKLYVACQGSGEVIVVDVASRTIRTRIAIGAEPVAVVAGAHAVYAVDHQAATVTQIDPATDRVISTITVAEHPWGASLSADGSALYVTHLLLHAGVTVVDTATFTIRRSIELAEQPADARSKLLPNGLPRGVYTATPRPNTDELWLPHLLLAVGTAQPTLDFESTVFATITTVSSDASTRRLLFSPLAVAGAGGAFTDVVSGPRDLAFSPDGKLALLANSGSEDVMVFDGATGNELGLVRPLPSTTPEGIAVDHAGTFAYVDGRSSHDLTVLALHPTDRIAPVTVDGPAIERLQADPMPADLRLGQRLFFTANSSAYPITANFWVSCSSCHLEGGTDAVTWRFVTGPRDTPSNAGGPSHTGFLFRQALRDSVVEYDKTINVEQGGAFHKDSPTQRPLLDALTAFVNQAIPLPRNPYLSPNGLTAGQTRGQSLFVDRCATCHAGPYFTDSGANNPTLDLAGTIVLHDVGTCVTGTGFDDKPAVDDVLGKPRTACDFDTPTLRGIFATPPYFHDGSAATLRDVVDRLPTSAVLSDGEKSDLVDYLNTL